jgi:hypothetical protein
MNVTSTVPALILRSLPVQEGGTDTGRRLIQGQTARVYGQSLDGGWYYLDAPAGRGWAFADYLKTVESDTALVSPAWPKVPNGRAEIERIFGLPGKPVCSAGRVSLPGTLKLSWEDKRVSVVQCHKLVEDVFASVFNQLHASNLWGLIEDYGGIYNHRPVKGSTKLSTHSWGIAVDLNPTSNRVDPKLVQVFVDHGFVWGGNFTQRPDPMHFQRARGY